jgi:DNA-binding GntR family transcriptional regulator
MIAEPSGGTPVIQNKEMDSSTLSTAIAADLRNGILAGDYAPGMRVRQEELAARFGTSRIPVREALKELESEGLVSLRPNSGAWIAQIDPEHRDELYKIRERIEPLALSESVAQMSDERISSLELLVKEMEENREIEKFLRLDRQFHLGSYADAGMPTLLIMIERLWNSTQHYRRAFTQLIGGPDQWIIHYEHRLLLEAIRRRDAIEAGTILGSHIRRTRLAFSK